MPREVRHQQIVILGQIILRDQDLVIPAVPAPRPVFVRPHQAERHPDVRPVQELLQRPLHQPLAVERIVIEHETIDARGRRHGHLPAHGVVMIQRIKTEIAGNTRLIMIPEPRNPAHDIGPLGEPAPPPRIVLRKCMELSEVVGENCCPGPRPRGRRPKFLERRTWLGEPLDLRGDRRLVIRGTRENAGLMTMREIMQQRIAGRIALQVALNVELGVEAAGGIAPFAKAVADVVLERIDPRLRDIAVGRQVVCGIELGDRAEESDPVLKVVGQCIAVIRNVVGLAIPGRIEVRARPIAVAFAALDIVQQRELPRRADIGICRQVPGGIEERIRPPSFAMALPAEMLERIAADRDELGAGNFIKLFVK